MNEDEQDEWVPTPEEIAQRAAEIQSGWTWEERLSRLEGQGVIDFEAPQEADRGASRDELESMLELGWLRS